MKTLKPIELKTGSWVEFQRGKRRIKGQIKEFKTGAGKHKWTVTIKMWCSVSSLKTREVLLVQDGDAHLVNADVVSVVRLVPDVFAVTICSILPATIAALRKQLHDSLCT